MPATTITDIAELKRQLKNARERLRKAVKSDNARKIDAANDAIAVILEGMERAEAQDDAPVDVDAPVRRMSLDDPYEVRNAVNDIVATAPTVQGAILGRDTMTAEGEPHLPLSIAGPDGRPMSDKQLNAAVKAELSAQATKVIEDAVEQHQAIRLEEIEAAERRAAETRLVVKKVMRLPTGPDADRAIVAVQLLVDSTDAGLPRDVQVMNHLLALRAEHGWDFKQLAAIAALGGYEREYLWLHLINHAKREGKPTETRESLEAKIERARARVAALEAELAALTD